MCYSARSLVIVFGLVAALAGAARADMLDPAFLNNGVGTIYDSTGFDNGARIAAQPDGKFLMCSTYNGGTSMLTVARFNADGSPDTGFGNNGLWQYTIPNVTVPRCRGLAVGNAGAILVAAYPSNIDRIYVFRLSSAGVQDMNFNNNAGVYISPADQYNTIAPLQSMALDLLLQAGQRSTPQLRPQFSQDTSRSEAVPIEAVAAIGEKVAAQVEPGRVHGEDASSWPPGLWKSSCRSHYG